MRISLIVVLVVVALSVPAVAMSGFEGRPITNNAFTPTGYTLHKGEFAIGLGSIAFGFTDNVQVGTNLLLWIFQVYNAGAKVALVEDDDRAISVGVQAYQLSLDLEEGDDESDFTAIAPYAAASFRLGDSTMGHVGGQYAHFSADGEDEIDDVEANAASSGTSVFAGIEHSYSDRTKFVADVGYDTTFEGVRAGGAAMFGWTTFRLKLGLSYYTAGDGFFFPIIGLWWRFDA